MHSYSADVTEPTCVQILQPGYKVGERILRPARVAVAETRSERTVLTARSRGRRVRPRTGRPAGAPGRRTTATRRADAPGRGGPALRQARRGTTYRLTRLREKRPVEHQGLPGEGLLQGPRRLQERDRRRDQEVVPQARPQVPPGRQQGRPRSEERFKEISEAYNVLSDEKRRKEYDEARSLFGGGGSGCRARIAAAATAVRSRRPVRRRSRQRRADASATCSAVCSAAAAGPRPSARPRRGADVETETSLSFSDAIDGVDRLAAADRRGPVQDVHGHRREGRHRPQGLPDLRGNRPGQPEPGQLRVLRAVHGPAAAAAWSSTTRARPAPAAAAP